MSDLDFQRGYLIACCNIVTLHDEPGIASDVLLELGITERDVRALDLSDYDRGALRKIRKARPADPIRRPATPSHGEQDDG